jgi:uncharacterized membrane protein YbhN (UPF0104 family)
VKTVALVVFAALLYASASIGMSDIAGYGKMLHRLGEVRWEWLLASALGVAGGLAFYTRAWTGIIDAGENRPRLSRRERFTTAIVGFGGFLGRGGSTVDRHVLKAHGLSRRAVAVRVAALDGLEHAPLAIGCCILALVQLTRGSVDPPPIDFVWPWAVLPPILGGIVIACTARYRKRLATKRGFLGVLGIGLDSIYLLWQMTKVGRIRGLPYFAMTAYWFAELFALWSALAAFGYRMSPPTMIFAYVAAYVITRRPAPLGGAGPLDLLLPISLWACGAPLSAAVAATIAFRFFSLWVPFPIAMREVRELAATTAIADEPEPALVASP